MLLARKRRLKLKNFFLLEDFKEGLSKDLKLHLEEQKVKMLKLAAELSDEYALTHKVVCRFNHNYKIFSPRKAWTKPSNNNSSSNMKGKNSNSASSFPKTRNDSILCYSCKQYGHIARNCSKKTPESKKSDW